MEEGGTGAGPAHPLDEGGPGLRGGGRVAADGGGVGEETVGVGGEVV